MFYQKSEDTTNSNSFSSYDQNKKIFLGGLSHSTTDETLRTFCLRYGKITDCVVMRTSEGKSRGFGFVTYEDSSSVEDFMRSRPHTIDNRQIDTKRAMPREDQNHIEAHITVKKLFIAGLHDGIDEINLRQYFSRFGNITEVLIMRDRDNKPRGFGFISFDDYDAVDKAILEKPHLINGQTLDVKKAVPKDKMQEKPNLNRNNFRTNNGSWDNQSQSSSYNQQGYNSSNTGSIPSLYNSMGQNQLSSSFSQPSMMNYNPYNNNNNGNKPSNSNFMLPSYGQNQQGYNANSNDFGKMNNSSNLPLQQNNGGGGGFNNYNNGPSSLNPYGNSDSFGNNSQNYGGFRGNYNNMPQQSRGGGPTRAGRGRGGGPSRNFSGNNNSSNYGNRSGPYPTRGNRGGGRGRGRGRGQ